MSNTSPYPIGQQDFKTMREDKSYILKYQADSRKKFLIGANFSSKTRTIDTPSIKELILH